MRNAGAAATLLWVGLSVAAPQALADSGSRVFSAATGRSAYARYPLAVALASTTAAGRMGLALAQGDIDGDGMPDLVVSLAVPDGSGELLVYPGNVDYLFPNTAQARVRRSLSGAAPQPFLAAWPARPIDFAADRMVLVDGDADGRMEVIVGAIGGDQLWRLDAAALRDAGAPEIIALDGNLTALAAGEVGRRDGVDEVVAASSKDGRHGLMLWAGLRRAVQRQAMPDAVSALAVGMLDDDAWGDVVLLGADRLGWIVGGDRLSQQSEWAPVRWEAMADTTAPRQLLLYPPSVDRGNRRGWLIDQTGAVRALHWQAQRLALAVEAALRSDGAALPALAGVLGRVSTDALPNLITGYADGHVEFGSDRAPGERLQAGLAAAPVALLTMRLNADALDDLIVLQADSAAPLVVASAPHASFLVENTGNLPDCNQGDGVCSSDAGSGCGSGGCTLRAALQEAIALPGPDAVSFSIAGGGLALIVDGNLGVYDGTSLDATTQPGYVGTPLVHLIGNPTNAPGLGTLGANNSIRGVLVRQFVSGIAVCGSGDIIEANIAGAAPGTSPANGANGVGINIAGCNFTNADQSRIGGTVAAARNYAYSSTFADFAASISSGCSSTANNMQVLGNYFGFEPDGSTTRTARYGGDICQFQGGSIGGIAAGSRNYFAGADLGAGDPAGIRLSDCCLTSSNLMILGNRIGAAPDGSASGSLGQGIRQLGRIDALSIGAPGGGNEIVGFPAEGLLLSGFFSSTSIQGNWIGQLANGTAMGNGGHGAHIDHFSNSLPASTPTVAIGGIAAGEGNVIVNQGGAGVILWGGERTRVRGNSIHQNTRMAIDIECQGGPNCMAGPTPNDPGDADGCGHNCANGFQNHPLVDLGGGSFARGTLNSTPGMAFDIDVYASSGCPPEGRGDLTLYLGSVTTAQTDIHGDVSWATPIAEVPDGWVLTATATDPAGNTSEPAPCRNSMPGLLLIDGFEG